MDLPVLRKYAVSWWSSIPMRLNGIRCYCKSPTNDGEMYPGVGNEPTIPPYIEKQGEPIHMKKARLLYQSRKRGMLENGLLLSTFAHKHLSGMSDDHLSLYDRIINQPSNDWEIFYWTTGAKPTPPEFDNEVMNMLKEFVKNSNRDSRIRQPDLY